MNALLGRRLRRRLATRISFIAVSSGGGLQCPASQERVRLRRGSQIERVAGGHQQFASVAEAVADCSLVVGTTAGRDRALQHRLRPLEKAGSVIRRKLRGGRVALLFGSEKRGLSNDDLSHCHWLLRIPTREEHSSMNLGQAVAVCLYELIRTPGRDEKAPARKAALAADIERISSLLAELLKASGYVRGTANKAFGEDLRRMVVRLGLDEADSQLWLGMLRQIQWKIRSKESQSKG